MLPQISWIRWVAFRRPCEILYLPCRTLLVVVAAQQVSRLFASGLLSGLLLDSKLELLASEVWEVVFSQVVALTSPLLH